MRDVEVPDWLKRLPLAPEFRPTDTEFADPIAYISKIEKEAGAFGICKVIPPLPRPSRKYVFHNLNKSLSKCLELVSELNSGSLSGGGETKGLFTTRQQELGQSDKRVKARVGSQTVGAQKQVWQSGEVYTLEQFELKSKNFAKGHLGGVKELAPIVVEALFWKASTEKPIFVEYANDVPGSGFGELEGPFRYLHRRRRRRRKRGTFNRNNVDINGSKNEQVYRSSTNVNCSSVGSHPEISNTEASVTCIYSQSNQSENVSGQNCYNTGNLVEGTAGWKLSNSPWNLQVIARSPGSLTRFMPDDIPGVTSPMIYIGMLFSWFAWHVEDHELHSLNYLHVGSPKTWYAVPGDYASSFEEAIRLHAYGGDVDQLDALTLLGEKTTLLSPEVIGTCGIPCCRLVQNPGEFVVTFPRAYHVGFSHGFNCGEAANFGTPKWLIVAKEAAVRRAAMNYLPMLSHQQLLYLLTMSFVSRVPRSLLLGERSSRSRNRQKEERELSVKKAFVEDLLKENRLLSILLQKNSSHRVVIWDLDMLPSSKVSQIYNDVDNTCRVCRETTQSDNGSNQDLYTEMSLFMDNVNDLYADDADDLLCDYQVDSGTLPCVACGILGFPFMAVVQPSEQSAKALLAEDLELIQQLGASRLVDNQSSFLSVMAEGCVNDARKSKEEILVHHANEASSSAGCSQLAHRSEHAVFPSPVKPQERKPLDGYLRPQIFCLEHAIQTVELLLSRGGSKVLGICHSDFKKIKAHAAAVAEDIWVPFTFDEIALDDASPEDLSLIDHATDDQENDESTKDWTARLGVSLRHCVKMRKTHPSNKMQHALNVGGLFSEELSCRNAFKWRSRRLRSKRNLDSPTLNKPVKNIQITTVEEPHIVQDFAADRKRDRIVIQYNRRKNKFMGSASKGNNRTLICFDNFPEYSLADCGDPDKTTKGMPGNANVRAEGAGIGFSGLSSLPSGSTTILQNEDRVVLLSENVSSNSSTLLGVDLPTVTASEAESSEIQTNNCAKTQLPEMNDSRGSPNCNVQKSPQLQFSEESICTRDKGDFEKSPVLLGVSAYCNENAGAPGGNVVACVVADTNGLAGERGDKDTGTTVIDEQGISSASLCSPALNSCMQFHMPIRDGSRQEISMADDDLLTHEVPGEIHTHEHLQSGSEIPSSQENTELNGAVLPRKQPPPTAVASRKRKREIDLLDEQQRSFSGFIRSPCEGLRPRAKIYTTGNSSCGEKSFKNVTMARKLKKDQGVSVPGKDKVGVQKKWCHRCNVDGCRMSFQTKSELALHMRNRCPVDGCGKKFNSHKYALIHERVHNDHRPLKCPWKGCTMTFKWAWARTEHLRVHTGERPYKCKVEGCGLTFRFVSDFSRHRRKTGHYVS